MTEEQKEVDWRNEVGEASPTLKVQDGETVTFVFQNEGEKRTHPDFGTSIVFAVGHEEITKNFYVRETNYNLQKQIKELGTLTGKKVKVSRTGSKKSDTRYTIEEVK